MRVSLPVVLAVLFALVPALSWAQQAATRTELIQLLRKDKQARLWPERTSGIVKMVNNFMARGFLEGVESGKGTNGPQFVLGGMRSGNGTTFGLGYRRVDLWGERLSFRGTARGTVRKAYMFDVELGFPRLKTERADLMLYAKYENSPLMDFYGNGPDSNRANRSSYRLEDTGIDLSGRYRVWKDLYLGATGGVYLSNTGRGQRSGFPSTDEKFNPEDVPGLADQASFLRAGGFLQYDWRDNPRGPRRGGNYYARHLRYWDQTLGRHTFNRLEWGIEQYIPYFNESRVIALRVGSVMTWARDGQTVPFYLQATLGGNEYLRGFDRYRFYDQNSFLVSAEHRWHIFSGGYAAMFFETGKVSDKASQVNIHNLEYSGGIGFRFTIRNTVIMRIDTAVSREGLRFMWTFSDMWAKGAGWTGR